MKTINGFEHYLIHSDGKVFASHLNRFLSPYSNGLGYQAVKLLNPITKVRTQKYIHRLVAEHYIGNCYNLDVNHIDGDKSNNNFLNLEIVSHQENMQHAFDNQLLKGFVEQFY